MENKAIVNGVIGFIDLLAIALIVFKLIDVITQSWVWVIAPIWIGDVAICVFLAAFFGWIWAFSKFGK